MFNYIGVQSFLLQKTTGKGLQMVHTSRSLAFFSESHDALSRGLPWIEIEHKDLLNELNASTEFEGCQLGLCLQLVASLDASVCAPFAERLRLCQSSNTYKVLV